MQAKVFIARNSLHMSGEPMGLDRDLYRNTPTFFLLRLRG